MKNLGAQLSELRRDMNDIWRRLRSQNRVGEVVDVDPKKGLARVRLQGIRGPFLTPWIPWEEVAAGKNRTHYPPSKGQQVRVVSSSGDIADSSIQASINSDQIGRVSDKGDEYVLSAVGKATIRVTDGGDKIILAVGDVSMTLTDKGLAIEGGKITHNGTTIDDTHTHGGILPGPASTAPPN